MSSWGSPLLDSKKLQNQQFYKIDWIRKNSWSVLSIWLLAAMMIMKYYWRFWEPWASAMLVVLLPKLWKLWLAQLFLDVFLGLTLTGPKKASKPTILHNRLNKELKLLVDVANLATCCHDDYDVLLEVLGTQSKCYISNPVAKTLVWVENHDWHNCFWMSSWGSPLLDPKKLQNQQFYIIDWIRKKLLVDVATLATCCHDDYDVLLEVLGTLGKCYVSNPVAKPLVWIENHDWHNCFWMSSWGSPLLGLKKASKLKDRITPQVNFFLKWVSMVLAGTGKEGKTKEVVKDREGKTVGMYVCMCVCVYVCMYVCVYVWYKTPTKWSLL